MLVDALSHAGASPPSRAAWIEIKFAASPRPLAASPPSRAAWIEMVKVMKVKSLRKSRRLHGRRGLKCGPSIVLSGRSRRRLHGRRGLKSEIERTRFRVTSRRLHGRRGLKCGCSELCLSPQRSPPSRAAWIEIRGRDKGSDGHKVAAFTGGVD